MVYTDSKVTNCSARLNETVILHVKNIGTVDLCVNACVIDQYGGSNETSIYVNYMFQTDLVIPVGVEAIISFPAGGGEIVVETVSAPAGAVVSGGVYAISSNPDPNPFGLGTTTGLIIYTRTAGYWSSTSIALEEE